MKQLVKKGFTIIELLVVITIIGILATGGITVYTNQITKARDSTRLTDIKALQWAVEQAYLVNYVYPGIWTNFATGVAQFMPRLPRDPRFGSVVNGTAMDYLYNAREAGAATAVANLQRYELSIAFEGTAGTSGLPSITADGWNDALRYEMGVRNNEATAIVTARTGVIANTAVAWECFNNTTGAAAACTVSLSTLIR